MREPIQIIFEISTTLILQNGIIIGEAGTISRSNQGRIKRGTQGALAPGPPSSKGPPATKKKTIITIFNNANVIKFF